MDFKKVVTKLKKSPVFQEWKSANKRAFLSSVFIMLGESDKDEWMFDYYDKNKNKITSFLVSDTIKVNPDSEIFKSGQEIKEVNIKDVKIDFNKILELSSDFCKRHFPQETPKKTIAILQNLDLGQVWNITYITLAYKTINLKVSSNDGEVLKHGLVSLYEFMRKDK